MNNYEKRELGYEPERDIEGIYGAIPFAIVSDKKLNPYTKLAAIAIAQSCNKTKGFGHRSNKKIASICNISVRAVETAFHQLEKYGYLTREWDGEEQMRFYQWTFETGKKYKKK